MIAVIHLDVPEWQIGQPVSVYFPDTMQKKGTCELLKEQPQIVRCKDCKRRGTYNCPVYVGGDGMCSEPDDWFCANGERREYE